MKSVYKILIPLGIVAVGILAMMFLFSFKSEPEKRESKARPKMVETSVVKFQDRETRIKALGEVISSQPLDLFSEVNGIIENGKIPFQPGQSFKRGDLILKIDDRQARLAVNSKKSELLSSLANVLPLIKTEFPDQYSVWQDYFDKISFDRQTPELPVPHNLKVKLYLSRNNVYMLYFAVLDLEIKLEKHFIKAPFDGSIVSADMRLGSSVRSGSRLGQVISLEDLEVEIPITVDDLEWINPDGLVVMGIDEYSGGWTGRIRRIGSTIDKRTQTIPVFVQIDKNRSAGLYDGIFLQTDIPGIVIKDVYIAPRRAVYEGRFVYLINNGQLEKREVVIARIEDDDVFISGGLANNDTLVTEVLQGVTAGMPALSKNLSSGGELN